MSALCAKANMLDPLDEDLHILSIRALLGQNDPSAALAHYEAATDLLYRSLGVRPSQDLRTLYDEIMSVDHESESDLETIQADLREASLRPGPYICEYGFFKEFYRLEFRRAVRTGVCVHVCLLTVAHPNGAPQLKALNTVMDQLRSVLVACLRQGDVVSKYSANQYVLMLHAANYENSGMVMERVIGAFYKKNPQSLLKLSYKIRALD